MADFCKQCSIENFDEDFGDFKGLHPENPLTSGEYGWPVICEGCGPAIVLDDGTCIAQHCLKHHRN